jgi:hypothetical protein
VAQALAAAVAKGVLIEQRQEWQQQQQQQAQHVVSAAGAAPIDGNDGDDGGCTLKPSAEWRWLAQHFETSLQEMERRLQTGLDRLADRLSVIEERLLKA